MLCGGRAVGGARVGMHQCAIFNGLNCLGSHGAIKLILLKHRAARSGSGAAGRRVRQRAASQGPAADAMPRRHRAMASAPAPAPATRPPGARLGGRTCMSSANFRPTKQCIYIYIYIIHT